MSATRTSLTFALAIIVQAYASGLSLAATDSPPGAKLFSTAHYTIFSTAGKRETQLVASAVEQLYASYFVFFDGSIRQTGAMPKLELTLYRDQADFRQHNERAGWAEALYLPPKCHAYFARGERNPYHWMIHEATHQLNHEVARFPNSKWINEGLATYFGASTIRNGKLIPGETDGDTYPLWAVARLTLSGDKDGDIRSEKIIALKSLISGAGGPSIDDKFNAYYVGYWSLTHFLFHGSGGRYAQPYRQLINTGGGIKDFERLIAPVARLENEWYAYLQQQVLIQKARKRQAAKR